MSSRGLTQADRFWAKVNKTETCWLWTGAQVGNGYGRFDDKLAHRWAYESEVGPIPDGLDLDHLCRVRNCVKSDHLEPVTRRENLIRGQTLMGRVYREGTCPKGHFYDEANTYWRPSGTRYCRTCHREANHRSYAERKA